MSTMTPQEEVLFKQIYLPTLVKTCAARGLQFTSQGELDSFLEVAALVDGKLSQSQTSVIKQASDTLKKQMGIDTKENAEAATNVIKTAAADFMKQPEILNAVLA